MRELKGHSSVTRWIVNLKAGDAEAAQRLWAGYFQRLVNLAQSHLGSVAHGAADEEDVAQSVFKSLCLGAARGKFAYLTDRNNLWALLVAMTANKAYELLRRENALKRGGGRVLDEAALAGRMEAIASIEEFTRQEPTPDFALEMAETCHELLSRLTDAERCTAELKLQGYENREIAERMDCGLRTVERRLDTIRRTWAAQPEA
jgi:RNA polymerase sigma factor (sigma-70 family)